MAIDKSARMMAAAIMIIIISVTLASAFISMYILLGMFIGGIIISVWAMIKALIAQRQEVKREKKLKDLEDLEKELFNDN